MSVLLFEGHEQVNYQASRLATEEADFRPALTPRSIDGAFTEKRMKPVVCKSCVQRLGPDSESVGTQSELCQRHLDNGAIQIVYQCLKCGRSASNPLAKSAVPGWKNLPMWDPSRAATYDRERHSDHLKAKQENRSEFFKQHDEYLKTPEWQKRRALVLTRANNTCEGCMEATATEVHHLTYENWQAEFLWELVAICHDCHERFHVAKAKAKAAAEWQPPTATV